jgi:predicted nucleic acid-binding protein
MIVEFVDTNVLFYAHDASADGKHQIAKRLVRRLTNSGAGALSIQVLSEFYAVATGKRLLSLEAAEDVIRDFGVWTVHCPDHTALMNSVKLRRRYQISLWDALIVNSAIELGCETLWTEDLNDGQQYDSVTVRNPFTS